jgi:hypothetical protein
VGLASWINTIVGVPTVRNFGSTSGQGSPIVINTVDGAAYYTWNGTVYRIGTGDGGSGGGGAAAPPADPEALWASMKAGGDMVITTPRAQVLSAAWTDVLNYETIRAPFTRATANLAAGTIAPTQSGTYIVIIGLALSFTPANTGKNFGVRLFNKTTALPGPSIEMFVGRDAEGYTANLSVIAAVNGVGQESVVQIGGGDVFNAAQLEEATFGFARVG